MVLIVGQYKCSKCFSPLNTGETNGICNTCMNKWQPEVVNKEKELIELIKKQIEAVWDSCYSVYEEPRDKAIKFLKEQYGLTPYEHGKYGHEIIWKSE